MTKFKPNRPIRIGTKMAVTDAKGNLPKAATGAAEPEEKAESKSEPAEKPAAKSTSKGK